MVTFYFLDTSALIKRYVMEAGTDWLRLLLASKTENKFFIAQITPVELVSATSRRKREGSLSPRTSRAVRLLINRHLIRDYDVIRLTREVTQSAMDLLEVHTLRAYDSIQLASALNLQKAIESSAIPFVFLSADDRLLAVAHAEGLATDNPNRH